MKTKYLIILSLIFILLTPSLVFANRGMMVIGPREVSLEESGQNAIVAWNGDEEIIILSTDAKSSQQTLVLEVLPLPSNPTKVEQGSFDSFTKLGEIVNKKVRAIREQKIKALGRGIGLPGVEITSHKKIGAHEVTVVKVNDLNYFINWVKNFTVSKDFEYTEISSEFKNSIANYLNRDIKFFVFDVIETGEDKQSIRPLIYRFKTDFLYYPLEITSTSDAGWSNSGVNIFLITKGVINETIIKNINLYPRTGFDYNIELNEKELEEVSPELKDLFKSDPLVMNAHYYGSLNRLNKDLIVYQQDVYIPTIFDKISQSISESLVFRYTFEIGEEIIIHDPILAKVFLTIILLSFIFGIPSVIFIISKLIKRLLKKYNLESFGYSLVAYIMSTIIITFLLLSSTVRLAIPIIVVLTIIGFSMLVFLIIKFFYL